jgi:hypothetical protein
MSDATEGDYAQYLAQQLEELRVEATRRQDAMLASLSLKGIALSGGAIKLGVAALDELLTTYVATLRDALPQSPGDRLTEQAAREMLVAHLRQVLAELIDRRHAHKHYAKDDGGITKAFDEWLEEVREKLESRVRTIELGVVTKPAVHSVTTNTVTAANIYGAVQQGGAQAAQSATVAINALAVAEALGALTAQLPVELQAEIGPDAETIREQLSKAEPNGTILHEAGKSIRNIVEGAIGGALGGAIPAGLPVLLAALGLG